MRYRFRRERGIYPPRGFGIWYEGGCLGSTYGESGLDFSYSINFLVIKWHYTLTFTWKASDDSQR